MRLVWQIIMKDLRRLRLLLGILTLLLVVQVVADGFRLSFAGTRRSGFGRVIIDESFVNWLIVLIGGFVALLAAAAVLEDCPAGDRAFWKVRPISFWRILAAKGLLLALVGVLAALFRVGFLGWAGLMPGELALAGFESWLETLTIGLAFAGLAAIHRTFRDFVMRTLVLVVVLFLGTSLMASFFYRAGLDPSFALPDVLQRSQGWVASMLLALLACGAVGGSCLLLWQFGQRDRTRRGVILAWLFGALFFLIPRGWHLDLFAASASPQDSTANPIQFEIAPNMPLRPGSTNLTNITDGVRRLEVMAKIPVIAREANTFLIPIKLISAELAWEDDSVREEGTATNPFRPVHLPYLEDMMVERTIAPLRLANPSDTGDFGLSVMYMSESDLDRLQREPARLTAMFRVLSARVTAMPVPKVSGGLSRQPDGWSVGILTRWSGTRILPDEPAFGGPSGERILVRTQRYDSLLKGSVLGHPIARMMLPSGSWEASRQPIPIADFVAINRDGGNALRAGLERGSPAINIQGLTRVLQTFRFSESSAGPDLQGPQNGETYAEANSVEDSGETEIASWLPAAEILRVSADSELYLTGQISAASVRYEPNEEGRRQVLWPRFRF